jgi:hypothetical protein
MLESPHKMKVKASILQTVLATSAVVPTEPLRFDLRKRCYTARRISPDRNAHAPETMNATAAVACQSACIAERPTMKRRLANDMSKRGIVWLPGQPPPEECT